MGKNHIFIIKYFNENFMGKISDNSDAEEVLEKRQIFKLSGNYVKKKRQAFRLTGKQKRQAFRLTGKQKRQAFRLTGKQKRQAFRPFMGTERLKEQ